MPRKAKEMSALEVQRLKRPPGAFVGGVNGLFLNVSDTGARSWLLKFTLDGRRPEMGLGPFPDVPLADARTAARDARKLIRQGINPIEAARAERSEAAAKRAATKTFAQCAHAFIKGQEPGWRNAKHAAQWRSTLETYAYPVIGELLVQDIRPAHVHEVLAPIWLTKHETATRVRSRVENVLDYAISRQYREGPNPARLKANLETMLAPSKKVAKVEHHAALDVEAMPAFWERLRAMQGQGAMALAFAILTAARSGEVRGATWAEVDFSEAVWTVPAGRMKMEKEHRVPLSTAALELLLSLPEGGPDELVLPSARGKPLSDMALTATLRRMGVDAVPHGFRSTFRVWAAEQTNVAREVVEAALAHRLTDKVEEAYQRSDLFEKRAQLMEQWAKFCTSPAAPATVIPIRKNRARR
jgi:integrase